MGLLCGPSYSSEVACGHILFRQVSVDPAARGCRPVGVCPYLGRVVWINTRTRRSLVAPNFALGPIQDPYRTCILLAWECGITRRKLDVYRGHGIRPSDKITHRRDPRGMDGMAGSGAGPAQVRGISASSNTKDDPRNLHSSSSTTLPTLQVPEVATFFWVAVTGF